MIDLNLFQWLGLNSGDSREILKNIPCESVDLVVTSPPYKISDGFDLELIDTIFTECFRVLKNDSLIFVNFGHLAEDKEAPFKLEQNLAEIGFKLNETIIWYKSGHFSPIQGSRRLNNLYEFIFMMHKGKMPELDRLSIGVPYKDPSNAKRFNNGINLRCQGNVWFMDYPTIQKKEQKLHNDRFPVELPSNCIKLSNIKKRDSPIVLDPFAGSGTTAVACLQEGVEFILIEKNPEHFITAKKRISIAKEDLDLEKLNIRVF